MKTGRVKSNGGRGRLIGDGSAYAEGTAFTGGSASWKPDDGSGSGSGSGGKGGKGDKGSNKKDDKKDDKEWFDWIVIAIDRIERAIEDLARVAESSFKTFAERIKAIGSSTSGEIKKVSEEIKLQEQAAEKYFAHAEKVAKKSGLSEKLKQQVRDGTIDITQYKGETLEKIQEYQEWWEKGLDAQRQAKELTEELAKLYKDKFDVIAEQFEKRLGQTSHQLTMLEKAVSRSEYSGESKPFQEMIKARQTSIKQLTNEAKALQKQLDEAVASGTIKEGSEAWYEMVEAIQKTEEEAADAALEISKILKDAFDDVQNRFENRLGLIDNLLDVYEKRISASEFTGEAKPFNDIIDASRAKLAGLNEEAKALEAQLKASMKGANGIKVGSDAWFEMQEQIIETRSAAADAAIAIAQAFKDAFDDVSERYGRVIEQIDTDNAGLQRRLDMLEARGYMGGQNVYRGLIKQEQQRMDILVKQREEQEEAMRAALTAADGISVCSAAWFEMQAAIEATDAAIEEAEKQMVEYNRTIRQLDWSIFDYLQDRVSTIHDESEFLIKLMEGSKLFDEKGQFTDTGNATVGLHAEEFEVYMRQSAEYFKELQKIEEDLANDPADTELIERREKLLKLQRDAILAAQDEKEAIKDLVEEGIKIELDALKELIDNYTKLLDQQKDQYEYQKNVAKQTKEIAALQKQLSAYQGDTSEENRARLQKLTVSLEEANEQLAETQYDQFISDTKRILDDLYDSYEKLLNNRLDKTDELFRIMINAVNANADAIYSTLGNECEKVGARLSEVMDTIWSNNGSAKSVVSAYAWGISTAVSAGASNVQGAITGMSSSLYAAMKAAEERTAGDMHDIKEALTNPPEEEPAELGTIELEFGEDGIDIEDDVSSITHAIDNIEGYVKEIMEKVAKKDEQDANQPKYNSGNYAKVTGNKQVGIFTGDPTTGNLKSMRYAKENELVKITGTKTGKDGLKYYQVEYVTTKGQLATGWMKADKLDAGSSLEKNSTRKVEVKAKTAHLYKPGEKSGEYVPLKDTYNVDKGATYDYLGTVKGNDGVSYAKIKYNNKPYYLKLSDIAFSGFTRGGYVADLQKVAYRNGDDMVTINTLKKGEAVLTTAEAAQFQKLVESLPALQGAMDVVSGLKELSTTPSGANGGGVSIGDIALNMQIDHVEDYADLVRHMRDDKTFERMIKTIVLNPLSGKSSMAKKSYYN